MSAVSDCRGDALIVHDNGEGHWQPAPANGFIRNILVQEPTGSAATFSIGTQTVAPGCFIREHTHDRTTATRR